VAEETEGFNALAAGATVDNTYKNSPDGAEVYTQERLGVVDEAFASAEQQMFDDIGSFPQPTSLFQQLEINAAAAKAMRDKVYAHEASIEMQAKGQVEQAPKVWRQSQIAAMTEDSGLGDTLGDWTGIFLWPDQPKDQADFVELVTGKYTFLMDGPDGMKKMINAYSLMTPEHQRELWPEFVELALQATEGNKVKAQVLLQPFASVFGESDVDFNPLPLFSGKAT
jgi:hypothetical protein